MQAFHIRYRNTQGTLMRILNAASRRGLDLTSVNAGVAERDYRVTLQIDASPKQAAQLYREWNAIVDVTDVRSNLALRHSGDQLWRAPLSPAPARVSDESARAALA